MGMTADFTGKIRAIRPYSWVGALLSLAVGAGLHISTGRAIEYDTHERFLHMARNVQSILDGRIKTYADLLRGASALFLTDENLSRQQFQQYVIGLDLSKHFPGVETINFARHVVDADRAAFEQQVRSELDGRQRSFHIKPEGRRPEYTVLTFVEPNQAWNNRLGMDLQSRPAVALALAHSRDTGEASTSGTRVAIKTSASGLGMRMPVYRPAMPLNDVAQRRAAYIGSVGIGFSVERLAQGVLDNMPRHSTRLVISGMSPVEEPGGPPGAYRRTVFFDNNPKAADIDPAMFRALLPVGVSGRGWDIDFRIHKHDMYSELDIYLPWIAMLSAWSAPPCCTRCTRP